MPSTLPSLRLVHEIRTLRLSKKHCLDDPIVVPVSRLIRNCLYIVAEPVHGLKVGQILSRNLDLTRELGHDPECLEDQTFIVYDTINDARRSFLRIHPSYRELEIPELGAWRADMDWHLRTSWTLHREDAQGRARFSWKASKRVATHAGDRNPLKIEARTATRKVGTTHDTINRFNTGRIPLLCMRVDDRLMRRTHAVRGIGRRMDYRAVVVEDLIDLLRAESRRVRRAAHNALINDKIFAHGKRSVRSMRTMASRMSDYAIFLASITIRPFNRAFTHVVQELDASAGLLEQAANARNGDHLDDLRAQLGRVYRSMCLLELGWRLEEMLVVVSDLVHKKGALTDRQVHEFKRELADIHKELQNRDQLTGVLIAHDFLRPETFDACVNNTQRSHKDLVENAPLKDLRAHLKAACKPL